MCEMWSNDIKIVFFSKKLQKIALRLGLCPPDSHSIRRLGSRPPDPVCDTFELQCSSLLNTRLSIWTFLDFNYWLKPSPLKEFLVTCQCQATASDLPLYVIFSPQKNPFSKFLMRSWQVICDLDRLNQKSWLRLRYSVVYCNLSNVWKPSKVLRAY